jgi:hypothetical protein
MAIGWLIMSFSVCLFLCATGIATLGEAFINTANQEA